MDKKKNIFHAIGISYKTADVVTRSNYSLSSEKQEELLLEAKSNDISELMIVSTCNRTEIIGLVEDESVLVELLCKYSFGDVETFSKHSYGFVGDDAIEHFISLSTGINSQIIGDYEIVGQLKTSFNKSKEVGIVGVFLERLFNIALQASKEVKNTTSLSSGTTSVSYATIQYIKENIENYSNQSLMILGMGKMGESTARNSVKHFDNKNIVLLNRDNSKSDNLATELGVTYADYSTLNSEIQKADIIIVATSSSNPLITTDNISLEKEQYIFDLSVPKNVSKSVSEIKGKYVIDVDELSSRTITTFENRKKQIPLVEQIIRKYKSEFIEWLSFREITPAINHLKKSLEQIQNDALNIYSKSQVGGESDVNEDVTNYLIDKIVSKYAVYLKENTAEKISGLTQIEQIFK